MSSQINRDNQLEVTQYFDHLGSRKFKFHKFQVNIYVHYVTVENINVITKIKSTNLNYMEIIQYIKRILQNTSENRSRFNQNIYFNKNEGDIINKTMYKHDFPGFNSKVKLEKNSPKLLVVEFLYSGLFTYNNMYFNWGMGNTPQLLQQNNPTVIKEVSFMEKSIYKYSYQEPKNLQNYLQI